MENLLKKDLDHILTKMQGLWDELRGERIFITGGTGFLGCWLLESFAWANDHLGLGASAVVLTRHPNSFLHKAHHLVKHTSIQLYEGDIRTYKFPHGRFSHVIHMASDEGHRLTVKSPLRMLETIVQGTWHTLEFAREHQAKKFLFFSSGAVYGKQPSNMKNIPEEYCGSPDIADPGSVYIEGKRVAELLCCQYKSEYGIETKIARGFTFVGPYLPLNAHFAIGNFIGDAIRGKPIQIKGDGTPYRSYMYAADAIVWLWTILFLGEPCRVYNIGSEREITIAGMAEKVSEVVAPHCEVRIACKPKRGELPERYVPSTKRARLELDLRQYINLKEAIKRTAQWYSCVAASTSSVRRS